MRAFSDKPYRYFPPRDRPLVAWLLRLANRIWVLPHQERIRRLEVTEADAVREAHARGDRLLFLPNHPTHSDGPILTEALSPLLMAGAFCCAAADYAIFNPFTWWKDAVRGRGASDQRT